MLLLLHELIYLDLPPPCIACDLNTDLERAHPSDRKLSPFLPPLLDSFAIMLPSGGEMDAFNHLSYQLCAKQQPH